MQACALSFAQHLREQGQKRAFVCFDSQKKDYVCSSKYLEPVAEWMRSAENVDADKHEGIFLQLADSCDAILGAFVWNTNRGQGCGGIRLREYDDLDAYLRDGLRLAVGMGRKNALAGLWHGGAKGVICCKKSVVATLQPDERKELFREYGRFLTSLNGAYVAAEDAGVTVDDVDVVFGQTRFTTCISSRFGGSGNPSIPTAKGIVAAMEAAVQAVRGDDTASLQDIRVAMQGVGQVGYPAIKFLMEQGAARVNATEFSAKRYEQVKHLNDDFPGRVNIELCEDLSKANNILFDKNVDIVSPCAYGSVLNETTLPKISARIICGAANNQLTDPTNDYGMTERGITYVPDFLANRMGIVNCANEQYGRLADDHAIKQHLGNTWENSINLITKRIIRSAKEQKITTVEAANALADEYASVAHPIFPHRPQAIISELTASPEAWLESWPEQGL